MITAGQEYINSRDVVAKRENCARLTADLWERLLPIHINEIFINNRVCRTAIYIRVYLVVFPDIGTGVNALSHEEFHYIREVLG